MPAAQAHIRVADHARVAVVPVVQAAHVWLHHADAALRCGRALHKAAGRRRGRDAGWLECRAVGVQGGWSAGPRGECT